MIAGDNGQQKWIATKEVSPQLDETREGPLFRVFAVGRRGETLGFQGKTEAATWSRRHGHARTRHQEGGRRGASGAHRRDTPPGPRGGSGRPADARPPVGATAGPRRRPGRLPCRDHLRLGRHGSFPAEVGAAAAGDRLGPLTKSRRENRGSRQRAVVARGASSATARAS